MRAGKGSWITSLLKPVSLVAVLMMVFTVVWLRSNVVSLEYGLSKLEKKKVELMKDRKELLAERANLMFIGRLESAPVNGSGFVFPDRVKVVYVKEGKKKDAYKASLTVNSGDRGVVN